MNFSIYDEENTMIMIPGPIEFHPSIIRAMAKKVYGHRTEYFRSILRESHENLKKLFGIKRGEVLSMAGSGTLAMDAALRSFSGNDDIILNLVCGKFSHRFYEIAKTVKHKEIITEHVGAELEWGKVFTVDRVKGIIDKCEDTGKEPTIITLCHNETSTGVIHDVGEITRTIRKKVSNAIIIVDGITSVGAVPIHMEDWDVDVYVAGSQKCLETPPGLAFIALSERAVELIQNSIGNSLNFGDMDGYYNHVAVYLNAWLKKKDLPFTGAVSLYYALKTALDNIFKEGLDNRFRRIRTMSNILKQAIRSMGLKMLIEDRDNVDVEKYASPTVTAVVYPSELAESNKNLDKEFRNIVRRMGILIAGGQSKLKGKIFRMATMGRVGPREIITLISVVEYALRRLGYKPAQSGIITAIESMENMKIDEEI
ncbi:MAG: alanine--glyoxylate aminotransferase family protein [Candidatus Njordarchaeota archaeon]